MPKNQGLYDTIVVSVLVALVLMVRRSIAKTEHPKNKQPMNNGRHGD